MNKRNNLLLKKFLWLFILCLFLPLFLFRLGKGSLSSYDEACYAEVAKNILARKDPFNLWWNNEPFREHPPAGIWLTSLNFLFLGINEFTARLASAVLGFLSVILLYKVGEKLFGRQIGFGSALMLVSSVWFIIRARSGNLDVILIFFILATLYMIINLVKRKYFLYLLPIFLAGALLIKTAVGFFLIPIILFLVYQKRKRYSTKSFFVSLCIFLALYLPYYLLDIYYTKGSAFTKTFIMANRGKSGFYFNLKDILFKLHMGVREWYYPFLISFLGNLFFLGKKGIKLLYGYLFLFLLPWIGRNAVELWHLIPAFPIMGLMIFSFVFNCLDVFYIKVKKYFQLKISKNTLSFIILLLAASFCLKQIIGFWPETLGRHLVISGEAIIAQKTDDYNLPIYILDAYLPTAVFYSDQNIFLADSLEGLLKKDQPFIAIANNWVLEENAKLQDQFEIIFSVDDKVLIKSK